jgi:exopolyphosphatase/guanosine-5'-triphosphate,3'-diphosphate pyrophosphatase
MPRSTAPVTRRPRRARSLHAVRVAAFDLGSNSFHLIVAEVHPEGSFEPIITEKEMLRLGDVVGRHGRIPDEAADAAVAVARRFRQLAEAAGAEEIAACGTSALRRAANGGNVVDRIEAEAGVSIEMISGTREAELIFRAIRSGVLLEPAPALCFDLGGGSVEIMVGDAGGLRHAASENLGVGTLTAQLVDSDPLSKSDRRRIRARVAEALGPVADAVRDFEPKLVVGSSGTLEDIARMVAARRKVEPPRSLNQFTFTRDEFEDVHDAVLRATAAERVRFDGLEVRRVDLIGAGVVFLATAMELFDFDEMTISEWALREGILLETIDRHDPADWTGDPRAIRRASVTALARRCNWHEPHARKVAELAVSMFDQMPTLHGLGPVDRELLEYACLLHDIGEHVSSQGHHRHGAYLVEHGQLKGFDPDEIQTLTALVRWHRRGNPDVDAYPLADLGRVQKLTALIRLADGLDRSRSGAVLDVDVRLGPSLVLLRLRTRGDAEIELWGARRKRELFERTFDRDLEMTATSG